MNFALFSMEGFVFLLRWFHFFFGILWIGHLYYFNMTQGTFMAEVTDAGTKSNVLTKLLPRALWWFRWGAMWTMVTGLTILAIRGHQNGVEMYYTSWGVNIWTGATLGLLMWANVWFVIWPLQKVVIANAEGVAAGKPANPNAAVAAGKALVASRTNTLFSIPMLFFMGAASHLPISIEAPSLWPYIGALTVILGALEFNALKGQVGPMKTVKGVVHMGFALTLVIYIVMEVLL